EVQAEARSRQKRGPGRSEVQAEAKSRQKRGPGRSEVQAKARSGQSKDQIKKRTGKIRTPRIARKQNRGIIKVKSDKTEIYSKYNQIRPKSDKTKIG
ncbi:MAG: hypothetical protein ACLUFH_08865, partial [Monoglobales bacterium]